jgi:hypothetical protein|tara:strand:+ start:123 stop:302 length:180 start_codon:yes stop_codon:yes gene_type:complete
MGKVRNEIEKIQLEEGLALTEVFKKYPHLETLQFLELKEENESYKLEKLNKKPKKLLLD